jgi:hypothetical protein
MAENGKSKSVTRRGYAVTRFNAVRHGVLSKHTVLPWEDEAEYEVLLTALVDEHKPKGPTEEHLVEELAGAIWRKRRLRIGEKAAHARALERTTNPLEFARTSRAALVLVTSEFSGQVKAEAVSATDEQSAASKQTLEDDEARAHQALKVLERNTQNAYEEAIELLSDEERSIWQQSTDGFSILGMQPDAESYSDTPEGLGEFILNETLRRCRDRRFELENRSLVREQSFGEAVSAAELDGLARYEVHLDRKFEKTLSMLLRLQQMRKQAEIDQKSVSQNLISPP